LGEVCKKKRLIVRIPIVVIGQLLWRDPSSTNQNYNDKVNEVNAKLLQLTRQDNNSCIIFWSDLSFLGRDGVPLNSNGMFRYTRSVHVYGVSDTAEHMILFDKNRGIFC
jgi:hypothetical protein